MVVVALAEASARPSTSCELGPAGQAPVGRRAGSAGPRPSDRRRGSPPRSGRRRRRAGRSGSRSVASSVGIAGHHIGDEGRAAFRACSAAKRAAMRFGQICMPMMGGDGVRRPCRRGRRGSAPRPRPCRPLAPIVRQAGEGVGRLQGRDDAFQLGAAAGRRRAPPCRCRSGTGRGRRRAARQCSGPMPG